VIHTIEDTPEIIETNQPKETIQNSESEEEKESQIEKTVSEEENILSEIQLSDTNLDSQKQIVEEDNLESIHEHFAPSHDYQPLNLATWTYLFSIPFYLFSGFILYLIDRDYYYHMNIGVLYPLGYCTLGGVMLYYVCYYFLNKWTKVLLFSMFKPLEIIIVVLLSFVYFNYVLSIQDFISYFLISVGIMSYITANILEF
jgi:hypothetical protein